MPVPEVPGESLAGYFDRQMAEGRMIAFEEGELQAVVTLEGYWALAPGMHVLEPGCGSGRLTERLARAVGPTGKVLAFDPAPGCVAMAVRRLAPWPWARVEPGDVYSMPAACGRFDVVVCFNAFPHFTRPMDALRSMRTILKPGGRLFISHNIPRDKVNDIHRKAPPVRGHFIPAPPELEALCREAGFSVRRLEDNNRLFHLDAEVHDGDDGIRNA